jgi:hypothetical protein
MARKDGIGWLLGFGGPAQRKGERQAGRAAAGGGSATALSGVVLRSEHTPLSREAERRTRNQVELHMGAKGATGSRTGSAGTSKEEAQEKTGTPTDAGDAACISTAVNTSGLAKTVGMTCVSAGLKRQQFVRENARSVVRNRRQQTRPRTRHQRTGGDISPGQSAASLGSYPPVDWLRPGWWSRANAWCRP